MSNNLGQFCSGKNPAWSDGVNSSTNMLSQSSQSIIPQLMNQTFNNSNMLKFQQPHSQVFQNALGIQEQNLGLGLEHIANNAISTSQLTSNHIFQQVGAVSYPNSRTLNSAAFQPSQHLNALPQFHCANISSSGNKQRVFTGVVTKVHDNFGFVDEDVFFQSNVYEKGSNPVVGDRVLVEASYNSSMPFKWNATRIQVLPKSVHSQQQSSCYSKNFNYNAVPPPESNDYFDDNRSNSNRSKISNGGRGRERSRDKEREEVDRKRRKEGRHRDQAKEDKNLKIPRRTRSPVARRRSRIVPRYMVQIPKVSLNLMSADVLELRRRYGNMYVPSDFFHSSFEWVNVFPPNKPFSLSNPCSFHIMNKEVGSVFKNDAVLEPSDADYSFSAKVMLMNIPTMDELYHKCCAIAEDDDKKERDVEERDNIHPSRLINFLIGVRGKNETMAIGGPWSPSLDGSDPHNNPAVLIKTAIRTCKALTGIDLSNCSQWYRFTELYYQRNETVHKGKSIPARVETVVIYLPDVWNCVPTRLEWDNLLQSYHEHIERIIKRKQEPADDNEPADEKGNENPENIEPTHYSLLDVKSMNVNDLKRELNARSVSIKGLRSQLIARLTKLFKAEAGKYKENEEDKETIMETEPEFTEEENKFETAEVKVDEKEINLLRKLYTLPEQQHIIVYPSKTAKSGKFDCTIMSLSLLLDYGPEDTKEHSFEVSLFAELFNEMLMRDFGFNIYKALYQLPEKMKARQSKNHAEEYRATVTKIIDERERNEERKEYDRRKDDGNYVKNNDHCNRDDKKVEKKSGGSEGEDDKDKKDADKKKRVKLYTKHKHLLLSFVYFDQTHCGYIFDKDIEDLLFTLGLSLSRAQIRKLVGKVITRDSLHYRKLTDASKDEETVIRENQQDDLLGELADGNNKLLPVFIKHNGHRTDEKIYEASNNDGMVMIQGALIDVEKLKMQLERSDKARIETESRLVILKNDNTKLIDKYDRTNQSFKRITSELKETKEKLRTVEDILSKSLAHSKVLQTTLIGIRDVIDPVLKSTSIKEDCSKIERDNEKDDAMSRWEKEVKSETVDAPRNIKSNIK